MAKWTRTGAFEHFGTRPRNIRWSWSARNEATATVVATLWRDQFEREDGRLVYVRPAPEPGRRRRPRLTELVENLAWAEDHCDGRFRVIIADVVDGLASTRRIKECSPSPLTMKLVLLDRDTGAFKAEAVDAVAP